LGAYAILYNINPELVSLKLTANPTGKLNRGGFSTLQDTLRALRRLRDEADARQEKNMEMTQEIVNIAQSMGVTNTDGKSTPDIISEASQIVASTSEALSNAQKNNDTEKINALRQKLEKQLEDLMRIYANAKTVAENHLKNQDDRLKANLVESATRVSEKSKIPLFNIRLLEPSPLIKDIGQNPENYHASVIYHASVNSQGKVTNETYYLVIKNNKGEEVFRKEMNEDVGRNAYNHLARNTEDAKYYSNKLIETKKQLDQLRNSQKSSK